MRDVRNFTQTLKYEKRTVTHDCDNPNVKFYGTWKTLNQGKRQVTRSQRSDLQRTTPYSTGQYYKSTDYSACFVTTTPSGGQVLYSNPASYNECPLPRTRARIAHLDEVRWEQSSDWGAWNIGLNASLTPSIPLHVTAAARSIMLSKLHTNDLDAGVFLGELGETVGTVLSLVKEARALFRKKRMYESIMRKFGASYAASLLAHRATRAFHGQRSYKSYRKVGYRVDDFIHHFRYNGQSYQYRFYHPDKKYVPVYAFRYVKGKRKRVRTPESRVASRYLEFIYGILPIMADIHSALSELENGPFQRPLGFAKGYAVDEDFNSLTYGTPPFPARSNIDYVDGSFVRGTECVARYKILNPTLYQLKNYGIENPLSVAWELTSLSFVLDWFTGIGNFVTSLNAGFGLHYVEGYETNFLRIQGNLYHRMIPVFCDSIKGPTDSKCGLRTVAMRRDSKPGFVPPPVYFRVNLSISQVLSSIALVTSALR